MKKISVAFCFLLATFFAQSQTNFKKNFVKVNFIGLAFGDGAISYERALNNKNSLQANIVYGTATDKGFDYQLNAYTLGFRYYFTGNTSNGWLINAEAGFSMVSADDKVKKETANSYIWRLYGAYKWTFKKGLSLEAGAGADGLGTGFTQTKYNGFYVPLYPYLNLTVGYAF